MNIFLLSVLAGVGALMGFTLWSALQKQTFQGKHGFEITKEKQPFWYWFSVLATGFSLVAIIMAFVVVWVVL